ncbi:hypothetical protein B0H63DRAFT_523545 [Podospora didyma]|uniref:Uncharacterized protein n=1 Tax=Podospora didyma TaxID=330526 RepID=A0AAE0NG17_9PEZI|nr:hypothetical protein B0H63DRAFT_523545 [Podospora didyma]
MRLTAIFTVFLSVMATKVTAAPSPLAEVSTNTLALEARAPPYGVTFFAGPGCTGAVIDKETNLRCSKTCFPAIAPSAAQSILITQATVAPPFPIINLYASPNCGPPPLGTLSLGPALSGCFTISGLPFRSYDVNFGASSGPSRYRFHPEMRSIRWES